jgi:hypothetical protein
MGQGIQYIGLNLIRGLAKDLSPAFRKICAASLTNTTGKVNKPYRRPTSVWKTK